MTTFLLNKMCLENEKKIGKTSFYDIFSKNDGSIAPQLLVAVSAIRYPCCMDCRPHDPRFTCVHEGE